MRGLGSAYPLSHLQGDNEPAYRTVPFAGLFPTAIALKDTLRMLLVLALIDGIFADGVQT
jgi:hypothetical protein